jgi:iron complex outermembrane receptor protein
MKKVIAKRVLLGSTGLAIILCSMNAAWAQAQAQAQAQTPAAEATSAPGTLETVTVTAQKRTEDVQKAAVSVTAISARC